MFKNVWLKIRLLFAKSHIGIDWGTKDKTAWCEIKHVNGKMYVIRTGLGTPPPDILRKLS